MKLQLSGSAVSAFALKCGGATNNADRDTRRVLATLAESGHNPFTRKDVTAVLLAMGFTDCVRGSVIDWELGKAWYTVGDTIREMANQVEGRRGYWSNPKTTTITGRWFKEQIRDYALDRRVAALLKKHYRYEDFDELLSEVREQFVKWSNTGYCDKYIEMGRPPTMSILSIWVRGKLTHRIYHDGQDAINRELRGARTQYEIRARQEQGVDDFIFDEAREIDADAPEVCWTGDPEDGSLEREFVDNSNDPSATTYTAEEEEAILNGNLTLKYDKAEMALCRDIVRVRRTRAADRYARFLDHLMGGLSKEETAVLEGTSELRVTHMFQRVRDDLRAAPLLLTVALRVLKAIADEPFSTYQELEEETEADDKKLQKELKQALEFLVLRGLVHQAPGYSYAPTDAGHRAVSVNTLTP